MYIEFVRGSRLNSSLQQRPQWNEAGQSSSPDFLQSKLQKQQTMENNFFDESEPECQLQSVFRKASTQTDKTEVESVFLDPLFISTNTKHKCIPLHRRLQRDCHHYS